MVGSLSFPSPPSSSSPPPPALAPAVAAATAPAELNSTSRMQRCVSPPLLVDADSDCPASAVTTGATLLPGAPAFVAITESKRIDLIMDGKYPAPIALPGYRVEWQPAVRTGLGTSHHEGLSGGLVLFIHSSLSAERIPLLCTPHSLFVKIGLPGSRTHTVLGVVYRRAADPNSTASLLKILAQARTFDLPLLAVGDYNARHVDWCSKTSTAGNALQQFCTLSGISVLNAVFATQPREATWYSSKGDGSCSTIDLALATDTHLYRSCSPVLTLQLSSDHVPLVITSTPPADSAAAPPPRPPHYRWTPEKADWPYFRELLNDGAARIIRDLHVLRDSASPRQEVINDMWRVFRDWVFAAAVPAVGRKKCGSINRERWHLRVPGVKEANLAFHTIHRRHCRPQPERRTAESHAALAAARSHYRRTVAAAKQKVWDDLCARIEKSGSSKNFWSNFRSTVGSPSLPVSSVHHAKENLPLNPAAARDALARHFADACSPFPHTYASERNTEHISVWQRGLKDTESDPRTDNTTISVMTVQQFCKKARRSAAVGVDQFSPHFLAEGSASVSFCIVFTIIVNYSWDYAVLPSDWRVANVCALFKGGSADPSSPDSFRPISLTSVVCKIMERIVLSIVTPLWSPSRFQAGFRSGHSTYDQHVQLRRWLEKTSQSRSYRHVAFLDFKKAFDKVDHQYLLYKLHQHAKIRGKPFRWIAAFLSGRAMRVVSENIQSIWVEILAGVPQGAVISPWLFLVFIDDIVPRLLDWVAPFLYADDIALVPLLQAAAGDRSLQKALNHCWHWSLKWRMQYGFSKTQVVRFSRASVGSRVAALPSPIFRMGFEILKIVEMYKYLGLIYDNRWSWIPQFDSLLTRAARVSSLITRICSSRNSLVTVRSVRSLIIGMFFPLVTFAAPFWRLRPPAAKKLDALIVRPLARVLRLPATTHHLSILIECGITNIQLEWERVSLSYVAGVFRRAAKNPRLKLPAFRCISEVQKQLDDVSTGKTQTAWRVPKYSLVPTVARIRAEWASSSGAGNGSVPASFAINTIVTPNPISNYSPRKLRRFAAAMQLHRWNEHPELCRDLHVIRAITISRPINTRDPPALKPAHYLLHDDRHTASLRARLRFNRSSLPSSQYRRQMVPSPACEHCGANSIGDIQHLLFCPHYRSIRSQLADLYVTQPTDDRRGRRDRGHATYGQLIGNDSGIGHGKPGGACSSLDSIHVLQGELRALRPQSPAMWSASLNITGEFIRLLDRGFNAI